LFDLARDQRIPNGVESGLQLRIQLSPLSVNSVIRLSVVDVLQDRTAKRFLDMIIPAYPARPQTISRVNTKTCFNEAQKCLDESTKPHSKLKAEWLALAECWIKTAEELIN
jgi:hypothetical protein